MAETIAAAPAGRTRAWWRTRGTLGELLSGRANGFGLIRLALALSVVVSHSNPVGYGRLDVGSQLFGNQVDLGKMAVVGFFAISGFMITGSGKRLGIGRYAWHRALRILPALWVCIVLTAFVLAPFLYHWQHGSLTGFWTAKYGPFQYIEGMWNTSIGSGYDISGIMTTGIHRHTNFNGAFDGALWSLKYEIFCYVIVGILAAGGVLTRARKTVALVTVGLWIMILMNLIDAKGWRGAPSEGSTAWNMPVLGWLSSHYVIYLGFVFLLGATFQLYKERVPVNDLLALGSLVALVGSLLLGGFFVIGYPAFAYLVIWGGVRMPKQLHWVGRKNDYSYGIYIYGFPVLQTLLMMHFTRYGHYAYVLAAMAITWALAWLSWHLVEDRAMSLRNWTPAPLLRWLNARQRAREEAVLARGATAPAATAASGSASDQASATEVSAAAVKQ
ncbi:acyltransferase family protein [Streptacidiphilus sp. MAP5-3]|uniref:acyltransferase family protein n=1 Tax=unclassified Streptacidiphilus TaxID=2643834 RepID=UPI003517CC36